MTAREDATATLPAMATEQEVAAPGDITGLLRAWRGGSAEARERLVELVYRDLKKMAGSYLRGEHRGGTLDATGLVH